MDMEVRARGIEVLVVLPGLFAVGAAGLPIWTTGVIFALGAGAALIWLSSRSHKLDRPIGESTPDAEGSDSTDWRYFRKEGLPFLALAIGSQLLARSDTFLLAALGVSHQQIGFYGAAGAPVWGIVALPTLLAVALYPTMSRMAAEGRSPLKAVAIAVLLGGALGTIMAVAINTLRDPLVLLAYGPEYKPAATLLARLVWVLPTKFIMTFLGLILAAWHRQHLALVAVCAVLFLSVGLNLNWIPTMGTMGSANAAVVAHVIGVLILVTVALIPKGISDEN